MAQGAHACTDEEYKDFYHKVFSDYHDPIFWIHLNVDYPFTLRGSCSSPSSPISFESVEGKVKLYNNQVYVADNIKEIIPEYLLVLKGVIDCPDLPLNVSRSFLQNDKTVRRIPTHITKKVGDRLAGLYKTEREQYEKYWEDLHPFIKYGCMRDDQFYDIMRDMLLFRVDGGGAIPLGELIGQANERTTGRRAKGREKAVRMRKQRYTTQRSGPQQAPWNDTSRPACGWSCWIPHRSALHHLPRNAGRRAAVRARGRRDARALKEEEPTSDEDKGPCWKKIFRRATGLEKLKVTVQPLKATDTPATLHLDEFLRRSQEMSVLGGGMVADREFLAGQSELAVNPRNPVVAAVLAAEKKGPAGENDAVCRQIYDLARLASGLMEPGEISAFIGRSQELLGRLVTPGD